MINMKTCKVCDNELTEKEIKRFEDICLACESGDKRKCERCGDIIDFEVYYDNNGLCDWCYTQRRTWSEVNFGEYYEE